MRRFCEDIKYVEDGLLFYLDGRDAPVDGKWIDRVAGVECAINGPIEYLASEKCYSTTGNTVQDANVQSISIPTPIEGLGAWTIQVVGLTYINDRNGCYISQRSNQNGNGLFNMWTGIADVNRLYYYVSGRSGIYVTYPSTLNTVEHLTASRTGNACRSFAGGVFQNSNIAQNTGVGVSFLFRDDPGWNMRGRIYVVRIYGRQLSDDEILYNYELDKRIFGAQ